MSRTVANETVGILGLGAMGTPMALRLLAAGRKVVIHTRRPRPDLAAAGAVIAQSARELGKRASVVISMLPDLPQLSSLLDGPEGLLTEADELLLLIGSISSPVGVRHLAAELDHDTDGRIRVVDCPVSGGVDGATAGRLSIMIGGSDADAERAAAVLEPCGTSIHLGPLGAGEVAKACNQMVVAATVLALGEASVLAERSGIDLRTMWTLLSGGYAGSNLLASRLEKLVTGNDEPSGVVKYLIKDLGFASDVATETNTAPLLLPALRDVYSELVDSGYGERDITVTRRFIENRPAGE